MKSTKEKKREQENIQRGGDSKGKETSRKKENKRYRNDYRVKEHNREEKEVNEHTIQETK